MVRDFQDNALEGATGEARDLYCRALEALQIYRGDPVELAEKSIEAAPDFAMAHILKGYLFGLATEPEATLEAKKIIAHLKQMRLTDRETSHLKALECLGDTQWTEAAIALDQHNIRYPHDILGIQCGHLMDFYRANGRNLRDRIARVLPQWSTDMPGYSIVLGMHSFGLEETGDYAKAEETGRRALDLQPLDCWAHHAVAHVMEMQGRPEDGIGWMTVRTSYWSGDDNFFKVHNWWHNALFHLELGQTDTVFQLYDEQIRKDRSAVGLDLVDASSLLWRLQLAGQDVGSRWEEVATAWDQHADGTTYPFNDWHAIMAYLGAGRDSDGERLLSTFAGQANQTSEMAQWGYRTALPLIQGFTDFWRGNYISAVENLHKARYIANTFGGSNAQRDIIDWTLNEAAIRGGLNDIAQALANERLALKPYSPINSNFLSRTKNQVVQMDKAG